VSDTTKKLRVAEIQVGDRHRKEVGDLDVLAASIAAVGLLHPVAVTPDGKLIAGWRRLEAVKKLGCVEVDVHVVSGLEDALLALKAERDENICRKDLTPSEAVAIGRTIEELERPRAKKRQKEGGRAGGKASGKLPEASTGRVRDQVAEAVGMSPRNYEKAKVVVEAAEKDPELIPVVEEMNRTGKVDPAYLKIKATSRKATPAPRRAKARPLAGHLDKLLKHSEKLKDQTIPNQVLAQAAPNKGAYAKRLKRLAELLCHWGEDMEARAAKRNASVAPTEKQSGE
jgi:ParB family chromosome partitioning protein